MLVKANITFDGQAEEAISFYKEIFNGKIENLLRYEEVADKYPSGLIDEKYGKRIVNARLNFGGNMFNVADALPNQKVVMGNNVAMDVVFLKNKDIHKIYEDLSKDGVIVMPLAETYFSPNFAVLIDKFGIRWNIMQMHD